MCLFAESRQVDFEVCFGGMSFLWLVLARAFSKGYGHTVDEYGEFKTGSSIG